MTNPHGPGQHPWAQPQGPGPYPGYGQPQGGYGQQGGFVPRPVPAQAPVPAQVPVPAQPGYGQYTPFQPPQGGFAPPSGAAGAPEPPRRKKRSALPWVFGGLFLAIAAGVVLVLGFVSPGWFVRSVFDAGSVEKGVQQTLESSYRISGVESVSCPSEQPVEPGRSFGCDAHINGSHRTVTVTVKDANGIYEVGHPR